VTSEPLRVLFMSGYTMMPSSGTGCSSPVSRTSKNPFAQPPCVAKCGTSYRAARRAPNKSRKKSIISILS